MAENHGEHRVLFKNATTETVTFVLELRNGEKKTAFTLKPDETYPKKVHVPQTHEALRLVVGESLDGWHSNELVSSDELPGLDKVVVKKTSDDKFVLERKPRETNGEGSSSWWSRRRRGASRQGRIEV